MADSIFASSAESHQILNTSLVGTQNDIVLSPRGKNVTLLCNNPTDLTITGIDGSGWEDGALIHVIAHGAGNVHFTHVDSGSADGNRINNRIQASRTIVTLQGSLTLCREQAAGTYYWIVKHHDQGQAIAPTFAAGDYTANGSMTWTVESADALVSYYLQGRILTVSFRLSTTTIGGTVNSLLWIKIPAGHAAARLVSAPVWLSLQGPVKEVGYACAGEHASNLISIHRLAEGNFILSTNTTYVYGQLAIEVG